MTEVRSSCPWCMTNHSPWCSSEIDAVRRANGKGPRPLAEPRDRWTKVLVEVSVRTNGNHRYAVEQAIESMVGNNTQGAHIYEGTYGFEVVRAMRVKVGEVDG